MSDQLRLIQICASENDLFGLDADGVVYHYNFNTNAWIKLGRRQRDHGESSLDGDQPTLSDAKTR